MFDRAEIQPRYGNGSSRRINSLDGDTAVESARRLEAPAPTQSVAVPTQRFDRLTEEAAESRHWGEQLESDLEKTTRRLQQLVGERNSLTSLLAQRDAELQRLNRELGALSARVAPGQIHGPALFTAVRSLLDRFRCARKVAGRANASAPRSYQPERCVDQKRLVPWVKDRPPRHVFAVVVFGLSEAEIERVLEVVERYGAEHEAAPLLLTDNDSFQLFRNRRVLFEFLPPRSQQQLFAPELDWQLFILRRLALIRRKWRPERVIPFGQRAAEVVQLWCNSPFEETALPTPLDNWSAGAELAGSAALPSASVQR